MTALNFTATQRNRDAILSVLNDYIKKEDQGRFLEIASGSGQHITYFAKYFKQLQFQPTDLEEEYLNSIKAWTKSLGTLNVKPPIKLDVLNYDSSEFRQMKNKNVYDYIFCANMIHIAPKATVEAFFNICRFSLVKSKVKSKAESKKNKVFLYGPFLEDSIETSIGNISFNQSLKQQNPDWGIRQKEYVLKVAENFGFQCIALHQMPANNLCLVFER